MNRWTVVIASALFSLSTTGITAFAAPVDRGGAAKCDVDGYLKVTNHSGADLRSAPRPGAEIIGHLPPPAPLEPGSTDPIVGAEFHILDAKNGWLLIENAEVQFGDEVKTVFNGPGWISGGLVAFTIGSRVLRAGPSYDAKIIAKLWGDLKDGSAYGPDSFEVLTVDGCKGHFAEVTIQLWPGLGVKDKPLHGWAAAVCSTQLTTCDPGREEN